jgi:hypothetical protein
MCSAGAATSCALDPAETSKSTRDENCLRLITSRTPRRDAFWLDFPVRTCLPRLLKRSFQRAARGEELFAGNRETFRHLFARDSILIWGPAHHRKHRQRWQHWLDPMGAHGLPVLRLVRPRAVAPCLRGHRLLPDTPNRETSCRTP